MIIYYSGTGNSKYTAERIAGALGDWSVSIEGLDPVLRLEEGEPLGFVTPTHMLELPVPIRDFLGRVVVQRPLEHYTFLAATYGTSPGCCGEDARRILENRNIPLDASFSVKMPDTWTAIFDLSDPELVKVQLERAEIQIDRVIDQISHLAKGNYTEHRLPYLVRYVMHPVLERKRLTKNFYVEDRCVGCGLCAYRCSAGAIRIRENRPVWVKKRCFLCMRCLHHCPVFAIQYGDGMTTLHGQYHHPGTEI